MLKKTIYNFIKGILATSLLISGENLLVDGELHFDNMRQLTFSGEMQKHISAQTEQSLFIKPTTAWNNVTKYLLWI